MNDLQKEFKEVSQKLMMLFEVPVIDKKTGKEDWIIFDVELWDNELVAIHVPLTEEQNKSDKIAYVSVELDSDFSLDEHLQDLYSGCITAIIDSDFYELTE